MCYSFNSAENRAAFLADPPAYMASYGLSPEQVAAVTSLQVLDLLAAGGNAYYLAKLAGIFGLDMQDVGAQQTGMSKEEFKQMLARPTQGKDAMARSSAASPARTCPPSAARSSRGSQAGRTGSPSSTASRRCASGSPSSKPDVAVVFYNDHGLNFFLDKMPTFAVGAASEYRNADEGWGLPVCKPVRRQRRSFVAYDRAACRGRVRRRHLPGDARRSRLNDPVRAGLARGRVPGR